MSDSSRQKLFTIFPQANDIYRVIAYVSTFFDASVSDKFDFLNKNITERQIHYYKSASVYLGLTKNGIPTEISIRIFKYEKNDILIYIMKLILKQDLFNHYVKNQDDEYVVSELSKRYSYSKITSYRRLSTIKSWCKWCKLIAVENNMKIDWVFIIFIYCQ